MMDKIELLGTITATAPDGRATTMFSESDEPPLTFSGVVLSKEGMGIVPLSEPPKNCIQYSLEDGKIVAKTNHGTFDVEILVPRGSTGWVCIEFKRGQKTMGMAMRRSTYHALLVALCEFDSVLVEYDEPREPRRSEKQKFDKMISSAIRTKMEIVQDDNN